MSLFQIIYNNYEFRFENKFKITDRIFVNETSISINDLESIHKLTFARSNSECGMWRLCILKPENTGSNFYLEKGINYTMSTFIILELQFYLNSILDQLPEVELTEENCKNMYQNIDITINNTKRNINTKHLDLNIYTINIETIEHINNYSYNSEYANYHPVQDDDDILEDIESRKRKWPPILGRESLLDSSINHGNTSIFINGKIYSTIISNKDVKHKLYYMIYDCTIKTPDEIHQYEQTEPTEENPKVVYKFIDIEERKLIIPIYAIPFPSIEPSDYDITCFGLYNYFSAFKIKRNIFNYLLKMRLSVTSELSMSKILEYISKEVFVVTEMPSCTTSYKFMGYYYNSIPLLSILRDRTLTILRDRTLTTIYSKKYIKYKTKYLKLKNIQH